MFFLSHHIDFFMGDNPHKHVSIGALTIIFFLINFLAATQDIAVDGWALTMLGKSVGFLGEGVEYLGEGVEYLGEGVEYLGGGGLGTIKDQVREKYVEEGVRCFL